MKIILNNRQGINEAGFDVTVEDIQAFFKSLAEKKGEISETEIDLVAGGGIFSPTHINTVLSDQSCMISAMRLDRLFC